ncbi:MAG: hypothetical protein HY520_05300 [Candidatus Aenigmarchaeota archaeon]|nr:hypothetical protein [Candidatus Aenigmarchaeota archaeon]
MRMKPALPLAGVFFFSLAGSARAHCPLCVAATGAAVATTRMAGVDDLLAGVFVGALFLSMALWFDRSLRKRRGGRAFLPGQTALLTAGIILSTLASFALGGLLSVGTFLGVDRLLAGTVLGIPLTLLAFRLHHALKALRGRVLVPYQVVLVTIAVLGGFTAGLAAMGVV